MIAESDANSTSPGDLLRELLATYSPCVILIDEWVAYARQLGDDDLPGGTFETQFTFAQLLTEAVAATPGALLLVSIPASEVRDKDDRSDGPIASDLETGGEHGRAGLAAAGACRWSRRSSVASRVCAGVIRDRPPPAI